jgi:hypothetical protein
VCPGTILKQTQEKGSDERGVRNKAGRKGDGENMQK